MFLMNKLTDVSSLCSSRFACFICPMNFLFVFVINSNSNGIIFVSGPQLTFGCTSKIALLKKIKFKFKILILKIKLNLLPHKSCTGSSVTANENNRIITKI